MPKENISKAILKAQKEMGAALKDSKNPFFKSRFADLNSVRDAVMPALHAAGISVLQPTVFKEGRSFVQTTLLHESGETFVSETEIVCAKQNDPQALGSAISYARRYGLQSLMCVASVDDDAEAGMGRSNNQVSQTVSSKPTPLTVAKSEVSAAAKTLGLDDSTQVVQGTTQKLGVGNNPVPKKFEVKRPTPVTKGSTSNGI